MSGSIESIIETTPIRSVLHFESIDSTNDYAKGLLESDAVNLTLPLLVSADAQTSGRGRGSKKWWTGKGAIAVSLVLKLSDHGLSRDDLPILSPLIAKAVVDTVGEIIRAEIHMPNDVYINGKKVCGILIESTTPNYCVIGIGVNTNNSLAQIPDELKTVPITTIYDETGVLTEPVEFLSSLFNNVFRQIATV